MTTRLNLSHTLLSVMCIATSWLWSGQVSGDTILLVTSQNGSLTGEESARRSQFQAWGHTVNTIWAGDSQAAFNAAVATVNLAYVTEEINSDDLGTKLRLVSTGVAYEERRLDDEFGMLPQKETSLTERRFTSSVTGRSRFLTPSSH